jgi:hypothetical protein
MIKLIDILKEASRMQQLATNDPAYSKRVDDPNNIKVGDFIKATYKANPIYGVVAKTKGDLVIIEMYEGTGGYDFETRSYSTFKKRNPVQLLNVRKKNIVQVGLNQNQTIEQ